MYAFITHQPLMIKIHRCISVTEAARPQHPSRGIRRISFQVRLKLILFIVSDAAWTYSAQRLTGRYMNCTNPSKLQILNAG